MQIAIKIDVDTDRGTALGVPALADLLRRNGVPATFLFSLGPDKTGRAITRVFRPGFLKKVMRSNVAGNYGLRTLLNGTLLPPPHIGKRHADILRKVQGDGFEVGIHCYDHYTWQDHVHTMPLERVREEFFNAVAEFERIFGEKPRTAGAPGWQANAKSLQVYDEAELLYGSDARAGRGPFFPVLGGARFKTLQIPSTLPTLDEMLGRPEFPLEKIAAHYLDMICKEERSTMTIHAELEGMRYAEFFEAFLKQAKDAGVSFFRYDDWARELLKNPDAIPYCEMPLGEIQGRSGTLAVQGKPV